MSARFDKLTQVTRETKIALYEEWKKKQYFEDYNYFYKSGRGVLSEAMGLTSVLLMYVCFAENKGVYNNVNDAETLQIVESSLNYLYDSVKSEGYIVSPLRTLEDTEGVIDKEHSYVDTLTWVLSSSTLAIYALRNGLLSFSDELEQKTIELIADSLARINNGQLESGAWGFSTDKGAKQSLYFTYAVSASLGDFLDYIFGELEYYSSDDNASRNIEDFYDWKTVDAINTYYRENPNGIYPKENITEVVAKMKSRLQLWLLENCLPLLPKLAECIPLEDDEMARIGMTRQTSTEKIARLGGKDYINLYYAYYVIDILTGSSSDKRFDSIAAGNDTVKLDDLKACYKQIMSESDFEYFFEKNGGANAASIFRDYINQAIHSARTNFGMAKRSGKAFWDSSASELVITWEHNEMPKSKIEEARGDVEITEPALVSMALRANTVYCFYIIERADITVDNMFDMICEDRSPETEEVKKNTRIKNLWDCTNYSLPITSRSIEALVDYCDYLGKTAVEVGSIKSASADSSVDAAIENKIESYLRSDDGKKLLDSLGFAHKNEVGGVDESAIAKIVDKRIAAVLNEKFATAAPVKEADPAPSGAINVEDVISEIENVQRYLMTHDALPERDSADYYERLAYTLVALYKLLGVKAVQDSISGCVSDEKECQRIMTALNGQSEELVDLIAKNCHTTNGNLAGIYRKMIIS